MIPLKSDKEIEIMRRGGAILAKIMKKIANMAKPGITTQELNRAASALVFNYGAEPAFLNHGGFPAVLCASVNNVVVHGVPSNYALAPGDIVGLDLGIKYQGYYTDMAVTVQLPITNFQFPIKTDKSQKLVRAAKKALDIAIKMAKPGATLGDISFAVQEYVEKQGFNVVRDLCGHGIGKSLHEEPQILNYGKRGEGEVLKSGMVLCFEPMITNGGWKIKKSSDGFGYETADGSLSTHFEHTIAITKKSAIVLTK